MKLPAPVAAAMTTAINQYLTLDEEVGPHLERLYGRLVRIELDAVDTGFYLLFHRDRIEVLEDFAGEADVVIRGAPFSMLSVASGRADVSSSGVVIEGDIALAEKVSQLMQRVDIDWEEHISRITGDAVAHQMGNFARGFAGFFSRTQSRMQTNTADYLRDETTHLPHDWEVEEFCNDVDDLRDRVDALILKQSKQ